MYSPQKKSVEPKTKKRKSNKDTVEPPTSTVFASSSTTSIVQLPPPPASTSSPNVRLRSPSIDKYHYADRTQSKRFWDPHGTAVIQVDAILYRVNATKLSLHSDYFRNNIPENATDDQDTVDNCPVYLVERVTPEDFEALLSLLEDSTYVLKVLAPITFLTLDTLQSVCAPSSAISSHCVNCQGILDPKIHGNPYLGNSRDQYEVALQHAHIWTRSFARRNRSPQPGSRIRYP